ncbi:hypothetical protein Bbelb_123460 [Branchiostoma belcheri]|nr:hypothetical protein Bbelb_123460 [Branchiostoma belcheri]
MHMASYSFNVKLGNLISRPAGPSPAEVCAEYGRAIRRYPPDGKFIAVCVCPHNQDSAHLGGIEDNNPSRFKPLQLSQQRRQTNGGEIWRGAGVSRPWTVEHGRYRLDGEKMNWRVSGVRIKVDERGGAFAGFTTRCEVSSKSDNDPPPAPPPPPPKPRELPQDFASTLPRNFKLARQLSSDDARSPRGRRDSLGGVPVQHLGLERGLTVPHHGSGHYLGESSNLLRMRTQVLGQSAPSLASSMRRFTANKIVVMYKCKGEQSRCIPPAHENTGAGAVRTFTRIKYEGLNHVKTREQYVYNHPLP